MRYANVKLLGVAVLGLVSAQDNGPEFEDIEIHTAYAAPIEGHTKYLTQEGSTTKWRIGVNTEYLTELTKTTTIDSQPTTVVVPVQVEVTKEGSDTIVMLADTVQNDLNEVIQGAAQACGGARGLRKRAELCWLSNIATAAGDAEVIPLVNPAEWNAVILRIANNGPAILTHYAERVAVGAMRNRFYLMAAAAVGAGFVLNNNNIPDIVKEVPHKFKFENGEIAKPQNDDDNPTTTTALNCPKATPNENSPACDDEDCKGKEKKCTADGDKKNCPCVMWAGNEFEDDHWDQEWRDFQQEYLGELEGKYLKEKVDSLLDALPHFCIRDSYGDDFNGDPVAEPSAFCRCAYAGLIPAAKGIFPTLTGEGDEACAYTAMPDPTKTISISKAAEITDDPTTCRLESTSDEPTYCTCNDNKSYSITTTTLNGKETKLCADTKVTDSPEGEKMLKIILEDQAYGIPEIDKPHGGDDWWVHHSWLFFSIDGDEDVRCQSDIDPVTITKAEGVSRLFEYPPGTKQYPEGTYKVKTQEGDCEYKNDGTGNPGKLWCGDRGIECVDDHDLKQTNNNGFESCSENDALEGKRIGPGLRGVIEHMEVITCAWD